MVSAGTGRRRPVCPSCRGLLTGDVVASRCNHVFHKRCLTGLAGADCPKCGQLAVAERPLDLFGASFGEDNCSSIGFAISRVLEEQKAAESGSTKMCLDLDSDNEAVEPVAPSSDRVTAEVMELVTMRREVESKKREYDEAFEMANVARDAELTQAQKLDKVERNVSKRVKQCADLRTQLEETTERIKQLTDDVHQRRARDAVREYYDILRKKGSAEALSYLTTMVKMSLEPAPLLVEVARLKEHHRVVLQRKRRESALENQKQASIRHELEEKRKEVMSYKRKLGRSRTSPSPPPAREPATPASYLAKRLRSFGA